MTLAEARSIMDVLVESGDDREREAWAFIRERLYRAVWDRDFVEIVQRGRLDRVAWGDGSAEHDE